MGQDGRFDRAIPPGAKKESHIYAVSGNKEGGPPLQHLSARVITVAFGAPRGPQESRAKETVRRPKHFLVHETKSGSEM